MKLLGYLSLFLVLAILGRADTDARQALANELTQLMGLGEMMQEAKEASRKQGTDVIDQTFSQLKTVLPESQEAGWKHIKAAADNLMQKVDASWTTDEAIRVWQQDYVADFSEAELRETIVQAKTPLGKKQVAAGKRANRTLQTYLVQQTSTAMQGAIDEYVAELQRIVAEATKQAPAN